MTSKNGANHGLCGDLIYCQCPRHSATA